MTMESDEMPANRNDMLKQFWQSLAVQQNTAVQTLPPGAPSETTLRLLNVFHPSGAPVPPTADAASFSAYRPPEFAKQYSEIDIETALLNRTEEEFIQETNQLAEYENKLALKTNEMHRLREQVVDLEFQLNAQKDKMDGYNRDLSQYETMKKFLIQKLTRNQDAILQRQERIRKLSESHLNQDSLSKSTFEDVVASSFSLQETNQARIQPSVQVSETPSLEEMRAKRFSGQLSKSVSEPLISLDSILNKKPSAIPLNHDHSKKVEASGLKRHRKLDRSPSEIKIFERSNGSTTSASLKPISPGLPKTNEICKEFNGSIGCTRSKTCDLIHSCVICLGAHPLSQCSRRREICLRWNRADCSISSCAKEHRCLLCGDSGHRSISCNIDPLLGVDFCCEWNLSDKCSSHRCQKVHKCLRCNGSHAVLVCPQNSKIYWSECRDRGFSALSAEAMSHGVAEKSDGRAIITERRPGLERTTSAIIKERGTSAMFVVERGSEERDLYRPPKSRKVDIDRRSTCKEWQNGKCFVSDCKFLHCCLRCKGEGHGELKCPLND